MQLLAFLFFALPCFSAGHRQFASGNGGARWAARHGGKTMPPNRDDVKAYLLAHGLLTGEQIAGCDFLADSDGRAAYQLIELTNRPRELYKTPSDSPRLIADAAIRIADHITGGIGQAAIDRLMEEFDAPPMKGGGGGGIAGERMARVVRAAGIHGTGGRSEKTVAEYMSGGQMGIYDPADFRAYFEKAYPNPNVHISSSNIGDMKKLVIDGAKSDDLEEQRTIMNLAGLMVEIGNGWMGPRNRGEFQAIAAQLGEGLEPAAAARDAAGTRKLMRGGPKSAVAASMQNPGAWSDFDFACIAFGLSGFVFGAYWYFQYQHKGDEYMSLMDNGQRV